MTAVGIVVFVVAGALLTSFGGAGIVAAPVTLPLLYLVVDHHPSRAFRIAGAVIGGLTVVELTWGLVYAMAGETAIVVWLLPVGCGLAAAVGFLTIGRRSAVS